MSDRATPAGAWHPPARSGPAWHAARLLLVALAAIGGLAGIGVLANHLTSDPLADVRAYYDAASRLNEGRPLYPAGADPNAADFYRYPPLLAIVLRPFVHLPFQAFALLWEAVIVAAFAATIWRVGLGSRTWIVLGLLGIPTAWAVAIGQAQVIVTLLMAVGAPWSVALAAQLKLFPALAALYWLGRGERARFGAFLGWTLALTVAQVLVDQRAALDFLRVTNLDQVGAVRNISPFGFAPGLWAILLVVGVAATIAVARRPWGWAFAVGLGTLSPPRLLVYQLGSLLAGLRAPDDPDRHRSIAGLRSERTVV